MAQSSQSTPGVTANIGGTHHQVNLRDYLNIRLAPFLKKAITDSLDAAPEFPLQWLGENLIHQSMLYEGNPDSTKIRERFLYSFENPIATTMDSGARDEDEVQPPVEPVDVASAPQPQTPSVVNGHAPVEAVSTQDASMSNHIDDREEPSQQQQDDDQKDTEMAGTS